MKTTVDIREDTLMKLRMHMAGTGRSFKEQSDVINELLEACLEDIDLSVFMDRAFKGRPPAMPPSSPEKPKQPRKKLLEEPKAIATIKEKWNQEPRPSLQEIADEVGYPKSTIADNIKKMQARGEL